MRTVIRILAWVAPALVLLFAAASVVLYFAFPREKILTYVTARAEARLGRPVHLTDAGVSFWPPFGVYLRDFTVDNAQGARQPQLLSVGYARAHLRLGPLLSRNVVLDEVELRAVSFAFERFDSVSTNVSELLAGEGGLAPILVEQVRLEQLTVHYDDRTDGSHAGFQDVSARLTVDPASGSFGAELTLPQWTWQHATDTLESQDPVTMAARGHYEPTPDLLVVDDLEGSLAGIPLSGSARVTGFLAEPVPAVDLNIGPVEFSDLMRRLPPARRALLEPYHPAGLLEGQLTWEVQENTPPLLGLAGELRWLDGRLELDGEEIARFASLTVPFDSAGFHVTGVDLRVLDGAVQLALLGRWQPDVEVEANISGRLRLEQVTRFLPTDGLTGTCGYAFSGRGPALQPERWNLRVRLDAEDVAYAQAARDPLKVRTGSMEYDGLRATARQLNIEVGRSRLSVSADVEDIPWARVWADTAGLTPRADVTVRSPFLDLDALFPGLAGDSAAPADTGTVPPVFGVPAHVELSMDTLIMGAVRWEKIRGTLRLADLRLWIDSLVGRVHGGRAGLHGSIDFMRPDTPAYELAVWVDSVEVGESLVRFSRAGHYLRGRGNLVADIRGRGAEPAQVMTDLFAAGKVELYDARLEGLQAGAAVLSLLGLQPRDPIPLASRWNQFRLENGRVQMDDFEFQALQSQWRLAGAIGLDGSLNYKLDVRLSPELSAQLKLPDALRGLLPTIEGAKFDPVDLVKDDQGQAELFLSIGGEATKPAVKLDLERLQPIMQKRFEQRVAATLKQDVKDEIRKGLKSLFEKRKP